MAILFPLSCVDRVDQVIRGQLNVLVVDGTISNLPEPQIIRLNRSKSDVLTGLPGSTPITKATVEVVVDSSQVISCHETLDGNYQLPSDFKGQIGHAYQLRFTLSDGTRYQSNQQVMPSVPRIDKLTVQFNLNSISPPFADNYYTSGHDVFADVQDPADQTNYYRWDWTLYEPQDWCRSCYEGLYAVNLVNVSNGIFTSTDQPFDDCFYPPSGSLANQYVRGSRFDYLCRTQCWEIINSHDINVFSDQYANGGLIVRRPVAHIPFYQHRPCLVNIRQGALTKEAYQYFDFFQQQTQNTGSLADTPPTILSGNVHNLADSQENVIGYFTASAVFAKPYYIDRKDALGLPPGLFNSLNGRDPSPESRSTPTFIVGGPVRPPTAVCAPLDQRTPFKPTGWPD